MAVDKNLFLHNLAVVAILKNEGHYLKEWLDYHLLAGADHFYLYDNDSTDNQAEVAKPYVEAGLVDYFPFSGKAMQYVAYNDAVKRFKFQCRYMAFIDGDEFIFPKSNRSIIEVVDEILLQDSNAEGLSINWQIFGSNGQDKADYSKGVLEQFTRRAPHDWNFTLYSQPVGGNPHVKTIINPRMATVIANAHNSFFFEGKYSINEDGKKVPLFFSTPVSVEKIAVNHYYTKSFEEFKSKKMERGRADAPSKSYSEGTFKRYDRNDEFDDGILNYRDARAENFSLADNEQRLNRVTQALIKTLSQFAADEISALETALTCRALSHYLLEKFSDDRFKIFEEASLAAILKSIDGIKIYEVQLLLSELPNLLSLPYPAVKELKYAMIQIISQTMDFMRMNNLWKNYVELEYLQRLLKNI